MIARWTLFLLSLIVCGSLANWGAHAIGGFTQGEQILFVASFGFIWAALTSGFWFRFLNIGRR